MKTRLAAQLAATALIVLAGPACSQQTATTPLALADIPAAGQSGLKVTSPAFKDGGDIPYENTQYRGNVFPGVSWTAGPAGTKSYLLVMQDNSLLFRGTPILHWTLYNIPAGVTVLAPAMSAPPPGAAYGPNYKAAAQPYTGPRTPPGPKDNYHFEIFALDTVLPDPGASYAALTAAMAGHVLASGEVVGLGQKDPTAP